MEDKKNKKYIVSYKTGIIIFIIVVILGSIIFGVFYFIQNKKDINFEKSRIDIEAFKNSFNNNK